MEHSSSTVLNGRTRTIDKVKQSVVDAIHSGQLQPGALVPSVRQISRDSKVSSKTAHRALQALASDGVLVAEPYRGYRVVKRSGSQDRGLTIAYALETRVLPEAWNDLHRILLSALQTSAHLRSWSLFSLGIDERQPSDVLALIRSAHAFGIALDLTNIQIIHAIRDAGIPAVLVDCGVENAGVDVLMQDGHAGGTQAIEYLVERGCRRIAWVGNTRATAHSKDRLSGALIGLHCAGLSGFLPGMIVDVDPMNPDDPIDPLPIKGQIRSLLAHKDRPDGILALWTPYAHMVHSVARDMGLVTGRDFHLVGWSAAELYDSFYKPGFADGIIPPAITWKAQTMADTAVARLAERLETPHLPPLRIKIPTQLIQGGVRK